MNKRAVFLDKKAETKKDSSKTKKVDFLHVAQSPLNNFLFLQRTIGNQAVERLIRSGALQTKLRIGQFGDKYEPEAERIAEQVMRMPESCDMDNETQIRQDPGNHYITLNVEKNINSMKEGDQPLPVPSYRQINSERSRISHALLINTNKMIQRYSVPSDLKCADIVDWLNINSPYAPEWAQTGCNYSFKGNLKLTGKKTSNGYEITVKGNKKLSVSVNCPIDHPQWSPSNRANRNAEAAAWIRMRASLDAHEQQHRKIGRTWRKILEKRFREINFTVTGADKDDAKEKVKEQVNTLQEAWRSDAQDAQDAIDPFRSATLTCP